MTKTTTTQTYADQVKADRRAAAAERRNPAIAAYDARVKDMYQADTQLTTDGRRAKDILGRDNTNKRGPIEGAPRNRRYNRI